MANLFVGYVVDYDQALNMSAVSAAGNNFQLGFIDAWRKYKELEIYTVIPIASWPNSDSMLVPSNKLNFSSKLGIKFIKFINIKFIKELSIMISVRRNIMKFCENHKDEKNVVISYNGNGQLSEPILKLKKKYNFDYVCLVVDPPIYQGTTVRKNFIWKMMYKALSKTYMRAARLCDVCVVLNEYFAKNCLQRKDYFVLDCGVKKDIITKCEGDKKLQYWADDNKFHMVFTGVLHEHSGILRFTEMFCKLDVEDIVLHIFGCGVYEEKIKKIAEENKNVIFHGSLKNNVVQNVQRKADLLICPNTIEHPINKVAFPSKIQEYMLSGVPVLATEVNGLGKEYYDYIFHYDDTFNGLQCSVKKILSYSKEQRKNFGKCAREFIIREKNWEKQVERLFEFMEEHNATN